MAALAGLAIWNEEVLSVHKELAAKAGVHYEKYATHKLWLKAAKLAGVMIAEARAEASRRRGPSIAAERAERWFAVAVEEETLGLPMTPPKTYRDRQIHKYRLQIQACGDDVPSKAAAKVKAAPVAKPAPEPVTVAEPAPEPAPKAPVAEPAPKAPVAEAAPVTKEQDPAYQALLDDGFDEVILGGNPYYRNIETGDLFAPAPNYQLGDAMPAWDADLGEFLAE